jgi:Transposase DDE domain group 1
MYLRRVTRRNRDGSEVSYVQLAHNVWDPVKRRSVTQVIPQEEKSTAQVEHFHRQRAQIEERFKDAKLGHALCHLPSRNPNANRLWLCCCLLALNLSAFICDISPAAAASGQATDEHTPQRRHAKTLRRILLCVPGRIVRTARRTIVRLAEGFPHFETFNATYHAALALPGP